MSAVDACSLIACMLIPILRSVIDLLGISQFVRERVSVSVYVRSEVGVNYSASCVKVSMTV